MLLYNIGIAAYESAIKLASPWHHKAKLWCDGRKGQFNRMEQAIDHSRPIVWIHVASLGEFEQGRPIIEQLRKQQPEYQVLVTFFSPSGYEIRKNYKGADYIFYLPSDLPSNVEKFLDIVQPEIAIFVKYEFWINMLSALRRRKIRTYIISAIFRRNSVFFRFYGGLWRDCLDTFETMFVQNDESKKLLAELGYDNVVTAGDTRFDRVAQIAEAAKRTPLIERFRGTNRLFIAGSTWGPDEDILQPLINANPTIKFVIAPHEMDNARIAKIIAATSGGAVRYTECSDHTDLNHIQVLVLDTVGMLSSVYSYATWAYIGGGFGVGIHNTLEAATFGLPIAFGPNYSKFKEARDLITLGAAHSVTSADELAQWFAPLRDSEEALASSGRASKEYTSRHQGATDIFLKTIFNR